MPPQTASTRLRLPAAALFGAGLLLYTLHLAVPPRYMFDEVYHAFTAAEYVAGNPDAFVWGATPPREGVAYTWNHPPAGLLLIAAGILAFGDDPWGWRFPSAAFGAIGLVVLYLLALRLTGRETVALLAACLLLFDGLYFAQSRIGMLDIFGTVFLMGAFLGVLSWLRAPPERSYEPMLWTGLFLGLATATKWNGAYALLLVAAAVLIGCTTRMPERKPLRVAVPAAALGLLVVPAVVYLLAYVPFFATGHGLREFLELQRRIFLYHTHLDATHPSQSSYWMWIAGQRPVWYSVDSLGGATASVYAIGNAVLYLAFVPAVLAVAWKWEKESKPAEAVVLFLGFFGQWLAWAFIPRISFLYHFLPAVPFGCVAVAVCVADLARRRGLPRALAVAYLALVAGFFLWWYPLESSIPLSSGAFAARSFIIGFH